MKIKPDKVTLWECDTCGHPTAHPAGTRLRRCPDCGCQPCRIIPRRAYATPGPALSIKKIKEARARKTAPKVAAGFKLEGTITGHTVCKRSNITEL